MSYKQETIGHMFGPKRIAGSGLWNKSYSPKQIYHVFVKSDIGSLGALSYSVSNSLNISSLPKIHKPKFCTSVASYVFLWYLFKFNAR